MDWAVEETVDDWFDPGVGRSVLEEGDAEGVDGGPLRGVGELFGPDVAEGIGFVGG